jgi:hypothetical protein
MKQPRFVAIAMVLLVAAAAHASQADWKKALKVVGAAPAALPRIVMEIDDVAPAHSRTYRNIVSATGVLCADRTSLFINKVSSDSCFQQDCRRISGSPYKTDITERDYKTDTIDGRVTGARPGQRIVLYAKTDGRWGLVRRNRQAPWPW